MVEPSYIDRRLAEGGLRLVTGSESMLTEEFARYEAERLEKERSE